MIPVGEKVPLIGSYSSALDRTPLALIPPATRTFPSANRVAVWASRSVPMLPVGKNPPDFTVSTAGGLSVIPPNASLTITVNREPLPARSCRGVVYVDALAPAMGLPSSCH